jgi:capsular polysaccharide biosynthesis protein
MELRTLLKILKRYWYLVVIPPLLIGVFSLITYRAPAPGYTSTLRFSVGYAPPEQQATSLYDRNYPAWLTSEYIAGGLSDWAKTGDFAQAVADEAGQNISAGEVAGSLVSDHLRSIVVLYLNHGDADRLTAIGNATIKVLQQRNNIVFPQNAAGATVTALDGVVAVPMAPSLRTRLDLPIRLALGLVFGVTLAFVAWYLDPRVRDRADVEAIGLSIIAEIPKK